MSQALSSFHRELRADDRPRLFDRVVGFGLGLVREWRLQGDVHALGELDERVLRDIGLTPGGVESAVRHGRARGYDPFGQNWHAQERHGLYGGPVMPRSWTEWR